MYKCYCKLEKELRNILKKKGYAEIDGLKSEYILHVDSFMHISRPGQNTHLFQLMHLIL